MILYDIILVKKKTENFSEYIRRTALFFGKIGDSWFPDLWVYINVCVYVQTSIYIDFYNRIVNK